jgi:hexulose-6-phosphate isomerase
VHLKDFQFDRPNGRFAWKNIGEGDVDWPEVRRAFTDIDYRGFMTTEVEGGDGMYLKDLVGRLDRFIAGQKV